MNLRRTDHVLRLMQAGLVWLSLGLFAASAAAETNLYETEPNDTPADANPITGAVVLYGTMSPEDQDGFLWTVSDEDARRRWTFTLQGLPGALTVAELVRVQHADNGAVAEVERLMQLGTRDGSVPSVHTDQLFDPGEYLIGIARAGGPETPPDDPFRLRSLSGALDAPPAPDASPWRFTISEGSAMTVSQYPARGATREGAAILRPGVENATYETSPTAWYAFPFTEAHATSRWEVSVRAPIGRSLTARLVDGDRAELKTGAPDRHGLIRFTDLAPGVTTWFLELTTPDPGFVQVVSSRAVGTRIQGEEAEPNDAPNLANRMDLSSPVTGRLGSTDYVDHLAFRVDDALTESLLALRIESTPPVNLRAILTDPAGVQAQYRSYITPIVLPDLALTAGEWGLTLSHPSVDTEYRVSLEIQGPRTSGTEAEPNDTVDRASDLSDKLRVAGRFSATEDDFFQILVPAEPQLWRFLTFGESLFEIAYYDGGFEQKAVLRAQGGEQRLRLDDIFLLPGRHFVRVSGHDGGSYTLIARPVGPPDPDGELEPNDEYNMQRLAFGQRRNGLLAEAADTDNYRFFLANWEHIRLTVTPPADGIVDPDLYWYGELLGDGQPVAPGQPIGVEGLFPPGDYRLHLLPRQVSDGAYQLTLERLPRFSCPADCEPNGMGKIHLAAPLPVDLVLEGRTGDWRDQDVYQLPAFETSTELLIRSEAAVNSIALGRHSGDQQPLTFDAELGGYRATVPAGGPYRLMLDSSGQPYRLVLDFPDGSVRPVDKTLDVSLELSFETDTISAYRGIGQAVAGTLEIDNPAIEPITLTLESATGDYRWAAVLTDKDVVVPGGGRLTVPLRVLVPEDAWADRPVRISVRGRDSSGRQAETFAEIAVARDIAPVNARLSWSIPESLRGGFNAAWQPFGASLTEGSSPASDLLRDGLTFPGAYTDCCGAFGWSEEDRPVWTLDLPGDEPVPVAGIALNHFGTPGPYNDIREASLLLSNDGAEFREVLRFETLPVKTEQHFPLDVPAAARFARLKVHSTFEDPYYQRLQTAEWKVILSPGFTFPGTEGFDLASPELGGHLVWDAPGEAPKPRYVLQDDGVAYGIVLRNNLTKDYVIAFLQNRAARIAAVEWHYPEEPATSGRTFETVRVSASLTSPSGPWFPLGTLDLSSTRTSATLNLPDAPWARFVRLSATKPDAGSETRAPALIRILERTGGDDYRSALTEWGSIGSESYYELEAGLPAEPALEAVGNDTRASAAPLAFGHPVRGQVSLGRQTHWYRMQIPDGSNTLTLTLNGDPTVRTSLSLENAAGERLPLLRVDQAERLDEHRYEAVVDPGSEVLLEVLEPPRNVVIAWDTSASVNAYLPTIRSALVAFSSQVVPGKEAVNLMPFQMPPLLRDWYGEPYVLQTILNDHRRGGSSSSAEWTLMAASAALAPRAGTKAIVLITDAETPEDPMLWGALNSTRPRIFGIGVAGSRRIEQDLFRDWASVNGGHYTHLRYDGEMEVAFDRATTLMHRPAGYVLAAESGFREAPGPGKLTVLAAADATAAANRAVVLILDASGSMLQRMGDRRRIAVAREVLIDSVRQHIPPGTPVAVRVFGHREPNACRSDLEIPLAPLDPETAAATIAGIQAMNLAKTPIADSLAAVPADVGGVSSAVTVVLVTDGEETCGGHPEVVIDGLKTQGIDVNVNIVGFAIDDPALAAQFRDWAALGNGRYFGAGDPEGLSQALSQALAVRFTVTDRGGNRVAEGEVGGAPVAVPQGTYRVQVNGSPPRTFDEVLVAGESEVSLRLPR